MPGIYTRDQFAQQLAQAIENANTRRQASLDREAQRTKENAGAIANFAKALGRTYETWGQSDEDKLAALQQEREETVNALKKQREDALRVQDIEDKYNAQVAQRNAVGDYLFQKGLRAGANPYLREMNSANDMAGYSTTPMVVVPNYADAMRRRSGVYAPRQDFDGVL